jgi:hypothetical protein
MSEKKLTRQTQKRALEKLARSLLSLIVFMEIPTASEDLITVDDAAAAKMKEEMDLKLVDFVSDSDEL